LKFLGWAETSTGNVKYQDQEVVVDVLAENVGGTKKLYAKWETSTTAVLNHPNHEGYNLDGWYNANDEDVIYLTKRDGKNWNSIYELIDGDDNKWYVKDENNERVPHQPQKNDYAIVGEGNNQTKYFITIESGGGGGGGESSEHPETRFTLEDGTVETHDITGTLDQQWMIDNEYYDDSL
jgi:hypothetical protein